MDATTRRRRRRRRPDRPPLAASLLVDDRIKDDVGLVENDLFGALFPGSPKGTDLEEVYYVAIAPSTPASLASTVSWTILRVRQYASQPPSSPPRASICLPPTSQALQPFLRAAHPPRRDAPIEILVRDVVPATLTTIYVTIDAEALTKLHDSHVRFGGGFFTTSGGPVKANTSGSTPGAGADASAAAAEWRRAVRQALSSAGFARTGDRLPLPLAPHPISHAPPAPARVVACEPVAQGRVRAATRVVIVRARRRGGSSRARPAGPLPAVGTAAVVGRAAERPAAAVAVPNGIAEEDEDTGNDSFYSAAEDRSALAGEAAPEDEEEGTDLSDVQSVSSALDDLSDDPDEVISLNAPLLPPQTSGILSSFNAATPRALGFHSTGIVTPGSVHSSFSTSTMRAGAGKGKVFKPRGLLRRIPDDLLHPRPSIEDDEEARIFVDTSALVKIGCFSGDWVRIENAPEPRAGGLGLVPWAHDAFHDGAAEKPDWRPVKVYGLPDARKTTIRPMPTVRHARKSSFLDFGPRSTPAVYAPPVLLVNLSNPEYIRISPLSTHHQPHVRPSSASKRQRLTSSSMPPVASQVNMLKILTPLSQDIQLQSILFAALKDYFDGKRRIIKPGDLVAIEFDEKLGRSMHGSSNETPDDLLFEKRDRTNVSPPARKNSVAWFKVATVVAETVKAEDGSDEWGEAAFVEASPDSTITKLMQKATEPSRLPPTLGGTWQYYHGVRRVPASWALRQTAVPATPIPDPFVSATQQRLRDLMSASTSSQAIAMGMPPLAILLTSSQRQVGKSYTAERACEDLGLHCCVIDAYDAMTSGGAGTNETEEFIKQRAQRALTCGAENSVLLFKHMEALNGDRMLSVFKDILADSRVIIATTADVEKISEGMRALFTQEIKINAPDESEREGILRDIVDGLGVRLASQVDLSSIALKTAALVAGDLLDVVSRAVVMKQTRLQQIAKDSSDADAQVTTQDLEIAGGASALCLTKSDFDGAVDAARKNFADAIGAPKIPNVGWDDVGGLKHVKDAVVETIQLPLARPELFAKGMKKRSGILFYGPPGTGKTLLAKAIATEFSLNFFSVKGPELLNMYIGESEANVRRVFQRARDARPCVVFFDELDSVAPKRGNQGDSGGVMDRIVSQLLAELDGMSGADDDGEGGGGVFVIGATNRPDLLDQALLRPGRFDKLLYLGISDTHDKQLKILEALTRKFTLDPACSLARIASTLPFTYTGADLYALCTDAMLKAITRQALRVDASLAARNARAAAAGAPAATLAQFFDLHATPEDVAVTVAEADFAAARADLVPSVSVDELAHYERVRRAFEGAGTGAAGAGAAPRSPLSLSPGSPPPRLSLPPARGLAPPGKAAAVAGQRGSLSSARTRRSDRSTFYFEPSAAAEHGEGEEGEDSGEPVGEGESHGHGSGSGDEYLIRTEQLAGAGPAGGVMAANGSAIRSRGNGHVAPHGHPPRSTPEPPAERGAGKGKGKSHKKGLGFMRAAFGSSTHGDDELYK